MQNNNNGRTIRPRVSVNKAQSARLVTPAANKPKAQYKLNPQNEASRAAMRGTEACPTDTTPTQPYVPYNQRQPQMNISGTTRPTPRPVNAGRDDGPMPRAGTADAVIIGTKLVLGADVAEAVNTKYTLYDAATDTAVGAEVAADANGRFEFPALSFSTAGTYEYYIKETTFPADPEWIPDDATEWPVKVVVDDDGLGNLTAAVSYADNDPQYAMAPQFTNTYSTSTCGLIEFPELIFDTPGDFEYTIKEITQSGGGWDTDPNEYRVIIHVEDDGYGNYVATAEYPDGYPEFVDTFTGAAAKYVISACKTAIGAGLPAGKFQFGLFDDTDTLVTTTTNEAADEHTHALAPALIELARKRQLYAAGTVYGNVAVANSVKKRNTTQRPGIRVPSEAACANCERAIERRLAELRAQSCTR